jgi:moderate conductance mechanosensitive channel
MRYEGSVILDLLTGPAPTPEPSTAPACLDDQFCDFIYERTGNEWLAAGGYYLLVKPARIVLIILAAVVIRHIATKMIDRLVSGASEGKGRGLLRPLRERLPAPARDATGLRLERRRQRAEALGSVLNSVASVTIFVIAAMLVLAELGVNLAPLIASAGIVGVAFGFGAQNLVKDFIAGLFMLLEDQYGVGDSIDVGDVSGTVEAVGLRTTTVRDELGVLWYVRNGEIVRVGNRSQGWALVAVDVPVGYTVVDQATEVLQRAAEALAAQREYADDLLDPPQVLGVEQVTPEGAVLRVTIRTMPEAQQRLARELRRRLTEAIEAAGLSGRASATRARTSLDGPPGGDGRDAAGPT